MRYVMVPVPTEFVMDVLRLVVFRAPDGETNDLRDASRLQVLLEGADDLTRRLLLLVAEATLASETVRFSDAVDELHTDAATLTATVGDINQRAFGGTRELLGSSEEVAVRVHGNVGRNRHLMMRPEHARIVRQLARSASVPTGQSGGLDGDGDEGVESRSS